MQGPRPYSHLVSVIWLETVKQQCGFHELSNDLPGINSKWRFFTHWPLLPFEERNVAYVGEHRHLLQVEFTQWAFNLSQLHAFWVKLSQFGLSKVSRYPLSMFSWAVDDKTNNSTINAKAAIHFNFSDIIEMYPSAFSTD